MQVAFALLMVIWSTIYFSLDNASLASRKEKKVVQLSHHLADGYLLVEQSLQLRGVRLVLSDGNGSFYVCSDV